MPRNVRVEDVDRARRDWYAFHFENRQHAKALTEGERKTLMDICSMINTPKMTVYGGAQFDHVPPGAYALAQQRGMDAILLNPWYLTDAGWDEFQRLWQQLPEPIQLYTPPCVQLGELYTLSTVKEIEKP